MHNQGLGAGHNKVCELIAFEVNKQTFAVEVSSVREIRGWTPATPMPQAPPFVCGIVNLRGNMLPVIDLSARLGFGPSVPSARHAIVVVQLETQLLGLLAESVSEVLTVNADQIQPTPAIGDLAFRHLVKGVLPHGSQMITLLFLEYLLHGPILVEAA